MFKPSIFKEKLEQSQSDKQDLLHQIVLNDATKYEEIALTEALQFAEKMIKFYNQNLPSEFKSTYCEHYIKIKSKKFTDWKK